MRSTCKGGGTSARVDGYAQKHNKAKQHKANQHNCQGKEHNTNHMVTAMVVRMVQMMSMTTMKMRKNARKGRIWGAWAGYAQKHKVPG